MAEVEQDIAALAHMEVPELRAAWRRLHRTGPPARLSRDLLTRAIAYKMQERVHGGLSKATKRKLRSLAQKLETAGGPAANPGLSFKPGAKLIREWRGVTHCVIVLDDGFDYDGRRYRSLSRIARDITGAHWSGPRFFGLVGAKTPISLQPGDRQ